MRQFLDDLGNRTEYYMSAYGWGYWGYENYRLIVNLEIYPKQDTELPLNWIVVTK